MIPIFFDSRQSASENQSFSPSAQKPALVVESWRKTGVPMVIQPFEPSRVETICKVHDSDYVKGVLECRLKNGFGNKIPEVAATLPWICGSAVAAAVYAFGFRIPTFSPTSGAHHAHYDHGGGYCTFNFLALQAVISHEVGARKVGILDLDCHHGDGTEEIINRLGLDFIRHYSFGAQKIDAGRSSLLWMDSLEKTVEEFADCELIIFNAGVDAHFNDPLGGVLSTEQMRRRDEIVYTTVKRLGIPITTTLAGGYQRDETGSITPVLKLHDTTLMECHKAFFSNQV